MSESQAIKRLTPSAADVEYIAFRSEAISAVQAMSHVQWSDYNFSDPGVTIIEQLAYALTELTYRASLAVVDILSAPGEPVLNVRRQGLMPAWSILPCNPVTQNDLRRLIIDRVAGVANVWFTPVTGSNGPTGLYDVAILAQDHACETERIVPRVVRCYSAHRALCEDVRTVRVLQPVATHIDACIELDDRADPSDTLATLIYNLSLALAPQPKRTSLDELLDRGISTSAIFQGPLMLRGFIADDELTPRPASICVDRLIQRAAQTTGVIGVDSLSVRVKNVTYGPGQAVPVPDNGVLVLHPRTGSGRYTFELRRNLAHCEPEVSRVDKTLAELWRKHRRTYALRGQYAQTYGAPAAQYRDLSAYSSVQNQFPVVYGVGAGTLPPQASPERRAQAKQLKGYLMVFDQLLADYFSQLGFVRELFSVDTGGSKTYQVQSLRAMVPEVEPLLSSDYESGIAEVAAQTDPVADRQNRILDFLLSLYGQHLAVTGSTDRRARRLAERVLTGAKRHLLRRVAAASRDRGRGFDYRRPRSWRGMTGVEFFSRMQLGLLEGESAATDVQDDVGGVQPLQQKAPEQHAPQVQPVEQQHWERIEREFERVDEYEPLDEEEEHSVLAERHVPDDLLETLDDLGCYRLGRRESGEMIIVCRDVHGRWWEIEVFETRDEAVVFLRRLARRASRRRRRHPPSLYVVESTLLRDHAAGATPARSALCITAVISARYDERSSLAWRTRAAAIVRENTPAHIAIEYLFLGHARMRRFQRLYAHWVEALHHHDREAQAQTSTALQRFIERNHA